MPRRWQCLQEGSFAGGWQVGHVARRVEAQRAGGRLLATISLATLPVPRLQGRESWVVSVMVLGQLLPI